MVYVRNAIRENGREGEQMAKYKLTIEGSFEKGDCYSCPISYASYDVYSEQAPVCVLFEESSNCPLEEVGDE